MAEFELAFRILFPISAFISMAAGLSLMVSHRTTKAVWGGILLAVLAVHLASYAWLLVAAPLPSAILWLRISILASLVLAIYWLFFVLAYTGRLPWLRLRWVILICVIAGLTVGLVLFQDGPASSSYGQDAPASSALISLARDFGMAGKLFVIFAFGAGVLSATLLLCLLFNTYAYYRRLVLAATAVTVMGVVAGIADIVGFAPFSPVTNLQMSLAIGGLAASGLVLRSRAGFVWPAVRTSPFASAQAALFVLDAQDRVLDLNQAARQLIGLPESGLAGSNVVGRLLVDYWPQGADILNDAQAGDAVETEHRWQVAGVEQSFTVKTTPLCNVVQERIGRVAAVYPVSGREDVEQDLRRHLRELERTNHLVTILSAVAARLVDTPDPQQVLEALGAEMRRIDLNCAVVTIDPSGQEAKIVYLPYSPRTLALLERLTGVGANNYIIPRRYWPGDRVLREKAPIWYHNPKQILRKMFPQIPDIVIDRIFPILRINPIGQICILPLISRQRVIGAMVVWGADLQPADGQILTVFASQVSSILKNALVYEHEIHRANELAHANALIVALSRVAARLDTSSNFDAIVDTFGQELKKMGLDCMVGALTDSKQALSIRYVSVNQEVIHWAEKMTGHTLSDLVIPRHLWPTEVVVTERTAYWEPNLMRGTLNMFPIFPKHLHEAALKMAGIHLDDPLCYLPLATEDEVIGVMAVWGTNLKSSDTPALTVFASQLATAIVNAQLYQQEARRGRELGLLLDASQATAATSNLDQALLTLATQLVAFSGFESCYISEWDKAANSIWARVNHSRIRWKQEKRAFYRLRDYPRTEEVLRTGVPLILQGDFEAEEKRWMAELGRTGVIILPLQVQGKSIALVEVATTKREHLFDSHDLQQCVAILAGAAAWISDPVASHNPADLFRLEDELKQAIGAEVCSISEWDKKARVVLTLAVSTDITWKRGQGLSYTPDQDIIWSLVLNQAEDTAFVRSTQKKKVTVGADATTAMFAESVIAFPLKVGAERIGLVELHDYNHKIHLTPDQITFLRTVADKASYSIQNARYLQETEERLGEKTALLREKETLLKEVHHRVKNNLQVIASMLNLQALQAGDAQIAEALRESQNRVRTMSLIHEKLYQSMDQARVDFAAYLRSLAISLAQSYREMSKQVLIQVDAQELSLDIETAIPCGLIVNELVSNAFKHAFPNERSGQIRIAVAVHDCTRVQLRISDDGVGLPVNFDFHNSPSLGLQLVNSLVNQIDGLIHIEMKGGAHFTVEFAAQSTNYEHKLSGDGRATPC